MACPLCDRASFPLYITFCDSHPSWPLIVSSAHKPSFNKDEQGLIGRLFSRRRIRWEMKSIQDHAHCHIDPHTGSHFRCIFLKDAADRILEEFDTICKSRNIDYYLVFGTCLGFYRDGGYVTGEHDIDVMPICSDDEFVDLMVTLQQCEFAFCFGVSRPRWYGHAFKNGILLDIWREADDNHGQFDPVRVQSFCRAFDTVEYNGRTYRVPSPVEGYLELLYGRGWRTPR